MLSPAKEDKNRKAEVARAKKNPQDFGDYSNKKLPKDYKENKGLVKASNDVNEEDDTPALTPEERTELITKAINELELDNVVHVAANGLPVLEAVVELSGVADITEEEVNVEFCNVTESTLEEIRQHAVMIAISKLEKGNEEHFTGEGVPRVEVLEANTGIVNINADERNDAFEMFNSGTLEKESKGIFGFLKSK